MEAESQDFERSKAAGLFLILARPIGAYRKGRS